MQIPGVSACTGTGRGETGTGRVVLVRAGDAALSFSALNGGVFVGLKRGQTTDPSGYENYAGSRGCARASTAISVDLNRQVRGARSRSRSEERATKPENSEKY